MQRSARCRGLWFKYSSTWNSSFLHTSVPSQEKTQVQPSCLPSTREQELPNGSSEDKYQCSEQLLRKNCWKLWQLRGLSVEEISCILHMRQDAIINIILRFERHRINVDWHKLCKLVMLTTSAAQAILVARSKLKGETSSSCGAALFSASDIKNVCPQNVTQSHIHLVHMMLARELTSSEILDLASFTDLDIKRTYQADGIDSDRRYQAEYATNARTSPVGTATNHAFLEDDEKTEDCGRKESGDFVSPISFARHNKVLECASLMVHTEYSDLFLNKSLGANDRMIASKMYREEKDTASSEGGKNVGFRHQVAVLKQGKLSSLDVEGQEVTDSGSVTAVTEKKVVTTFDILHWLQNNNRATISNIVDAFGYCEAKNLLFLLLEMLESSIIVEQEGMLRIALERSSRRLEEPTESPQALPNPLINKRMHRALCLKAVVLNVVIHEPKANVEFVIRHLKVDDDKSTVYHVQICRCPSCTCPDFATQFTPGFNYMPCKHLFYVYLVQLHLEKDLEHLMLQRDLKEEDLERILQGHY